jgi:adenosine deaminase
VVNHIQPDRIGHGQLCVQDKAIMKAIRENDIVLETCITSNLRNKKVGNIEEMKKIIHTYLENGIKFTLNTDGPEMYHTNIYKEQMLALHEGMLTEEQIKDCTKTAFSATFIS